MADDFARRDVRILADSFHAADQVAALMREAWEKAGRPAGQILCSFGRSGITFGFEPELPYEPSLTGGRISNIGDPAQDWRYDHAETCPVRQGYPIAECDCEKKPNG